MFKKCIIINKNKIKYLYCSSQHCERTYSLVTQLLPVLNTSYKRNRRCFMVSEGLSLVKPPFTSELLIKLLNELLTSPLSSNALSELLTSPSAQALLRGGGGRDAPAQGRPVCDDPGRNGRLPCRTVGEPQTCSSSCFPFVGMRPVIRLFISLPLLPVVGLFFSLHFSSFSAFLRSLFTQSSHLTRGLPLFYYLHVSLSQILSAISLSLRPRVHSISPGS